MTRMLDRSKFNFKVFQFQTFEVIHTDSIFKVIVMINSCFKVMQIQGDLKFRLKLIQVDSSFNVIETDQLFKKMQIHISK